LASTELPRIRFHDLRHSPATIMLKSNIHPKIVSERLGHSRVALTMDTYVTSFPTCKKGPRRRLTLHSARRYTSRAENAVAKR